MILRDKKLIKKGLKTEKAKLVLVIGLKELELTIFPRAELPIIESI